MTLLPERRGRARDIWLAVVPRILRHRIASQSRLFWHVLEIGRSVLEDRDPLPMCPMAIFGTLDAIKSYTFRRSNHMNNQSKTLRRIGEGLLSFLAAGLSLLILQFALAG